MVLSVCLVFCMAQPFLLFFTFILPVSLYSMCFLQRAYGYIILTQSEKFDFLIGVFSTFTINIITEIIEYQQILLFLSSCFHCFFTPPFIDLFVYLYSYLFIYVICMSVNTHVSCPYRGQKMVLDPLELELQTAVNCHMGVGNKCS